MFRYTITLLALVGASLAQNQLTVGLFSQNLFAKTFGGTSGDAAYSVTQTTDGGLAVAGGTESFGAGNSDFLVLKMASDGSLSWARTFGGTNYDYAFSMTQTSDGGYAVAGYIYSLGAGSNDFLVLKLTSNGSLSWARTFGGSDNDYAQSIIQTSDGGYAVAGTTWSFGVGNGDFLILKLTSNGSLSWARTFGGTDEDYARSIIQTSDGGFAVAGGTRSLGAGGDDLLVLKLTSDGSLSWARTFGEQFNDYALSIIQTSGGGYAVAGTTWSFGAGNSDFLILKLTSNGSLSWAKTFGGTDEDHAFSIIQTSDEGYAVAGGTRSFGVGNWDLLILKLDQNGNYPGCVQACNIMVVDVNPGTSSPSVGEDCSPTTTNPALTLDMPSPTITDACQPVAVEEVDILPGSGITCSPLPKGALFISPGDMPIKIYSADGRLAYSGELTKGENRISLEGGVYLWRAGQFKGKAVIR